MPQIVLKGVLYRKCNRVSKFGGKGGEGRVSVNILKHPFFFLRVQPMAKYRILLTNFSSGLQIDFLGPN